jgi:hypothetical protein
MAANRFLWLDSYEWSVTLTGSALMVLAMWVRTRARHQSWRRQAQGGPRRARRSRGRAPSRGNRSSRAFGTMIRT